MTRLKPRPERFCQRFIECGNAALAAKAAGYTPASARNTGYRLLRTPKILQRIAELRESLATTQCQNSHVLLGKLETVYQQALEDHQFSAAARAVELQAKLAGLAERPPSRVRITPDASGGALYGTEPRSSSPRRPTGEGSASPTPAATSATAGHSPNSSPPRCP